jgi:hypothetical protein
MGGPAARSTRTQILRRHLAAYWPLQATPLLWGAIVASETA